MTIDIDTLFKGLDLVVVPFIAWLVPTIIKLKIEVAVLKTNVVNLTRSIEKNTVN